MQLPASRYRILCLVGRGQFGRVYVARHRVSGRLVALKELDQIRFPTNKFLRELRFLLSLRHPNIVACEALEHTRTGRYLVMDYCEGGTLRALVQEDVRLSLPVVLNLTCEVLVGLKQAHQQGIIHCDIKPENILLNLSPTSWTARISDFGIARLGQELEAATRSGVGRSRTVEDSSQGNTGSPAYMAPERFYGEFSVCSDLYAVGIMLYEMLLGRRPFSGMPAELMSAHLNQPVELPLSLDEPLREVLHTALQKLPARRFKSAEQMLVALRECTVRLKQAALPQLETGVPLVPRQLLAPLDLTSSRAEQWQQQPLRLPLTALQVIAPASDTPLLCWAAKTQVGWRSLTSLFEFEPAFSCSQLTEQPDSSKTESSLERIPVVDLHAEVRSLHLSSQGCYATTQEGVYQVQPWAACRPLIEKQQDLVGALDPDGRWLAVASRQVLTLLSPLSGRLIRQLSLPESTYLPSLNVLDRHHLAIVCGGEQSQIQVLSRRGNCMEKFDLPMPITQAVTGRVPYHLLAASPREPKTLLLIDLKAFQVRRLFLGYLPTLLQSTPWGYIAAGARQTLTLLDPVGQIVGNLTLAGQPTAVIAHGPHHLLVATWAGTQGRLYYLDLSRLELELLF
ncbi:serine/threonine protein kinase [Leptolyngbya sp. FACHB-261]|nr:serine/threonine protein kinase [Leptolyngbya sp. FACHB-261]